VCVVGRASNCSRARAAVQNRQRRRAQAVEVQVSAETCKAAANVLMYSLQ
jgi:hypothetical protein